MPELSETFISRLKSLVDRFDLPWDYAPLHRHLEAAQASGRLAGMNVRPRESVEEHTSI